MILIGLVAASAATAAPDFVTEFGRTCASAGSLTGLNQSLVKEGWKSIPNSQGQIAAVIAAVAPMLDAQGLSSDYVTYARDADGGHYELAVSETKKPITDGHKLIGCSMYDFAATAPVNREQIEVFAKGNAGQRSSLGDISIEKWSDQRGRGSGMRAVFVPPSSPVKATLGFTGMMLGTHFLDGATK